MIKRILSPALACCALFAANHVKAQTTIVDWDFDSLPIASNASPAPSSGANASSASASALGMSNSYNSTNSVSNPDIESEPGASTGSSSQSWRIRGKGTAPNGGNGWSTQAPIGTQGAQFSVSTAGYDNIALSFDFYATTQGEAKMAVEYTTDGSSWNLANSISYAGLNASIQNNSSSANTVDGNYFLITTDDGNQWFNDITVDLTGISGVNNDPNFGIRLVNAATGTDDTGAAGGTYNNSSGNWQFDNVDVTGDVTPTPEPSTYALLGMGFAGLWSFRRCKKS